MRYARCAVTLTLDSLMPSLPATSTDKVDYPRLQALASGADPEAA